MAEATDVDAELWGFTRTEAGAKAWVHAAMAARNHAMGYGGTNAAKAGAATKQPCGYGQHCGCRRVSTT